MDLKNFLSIAGLAITLTSGTAIAETTSIDSCSIDAERAVKVDVKNFDGCSVITIQEDDGTVLNMNCGCSGGTCNSSCKGVCW